MLSCEKKRQKRRKKQDREGGESDLIQRRCSLWGSAIVWVRTPVGRHALLRWKDGDEDISWIWVARLPRVVVVGRVGERRGWKATERGRPRGDSVAIRIRFVAIN